MKAKEQRWRLPRRPPPIEVTIEIAAPAEADDQMENATADEEGTMAEEEAALTLVTSANEIRNVLEAAATAETLTNIVETADMALGRLANKLSRGRAPHDLELSPS
eukprot:146050-Heterocapsa_arctica.AAC.1